MIGTALLTMMCATLAQHLGLPEAITRIAVKVSSCHKCLTFWCCLAILFFKGYDIFVSIGLSFSMAYLSYWFALLLFDIDTKYDMIWQRLKRRKDQ